MLEIASHVVPWQSTLLRDRNLNKKIDEAHNLGLTNYLPKTTQNGILTKKYFLSFRFLSLVSFFPASVPHGGPLCPLPKMEHMVVALTPRVHRAWESLRRGPPLPQHPAPLVRTTSCPAEIPEQIVQAVADPR